MLDIRGDVDRAVQTLADAEARAQYLRYQPGATSLLTDPTSAPLLSPFTLMLTSCRQLVSAAYLVLGCDAEDNAGWERAVSEITSALSGVVGLQGLWLSLREEPE